jgi:hypothetical protein
MPVDKGLPGDDEFGHYAQPPVGPEHIPDLKQGLSWSAHVFHYLSASNKIIHCIPDIRVWGIERVKDFYVISSFLAHGSQGRSWAGAKIQACSRWGHIFLKRLENPGQKIPIPEIVDLVCMFIVAGPFLVCVEMSIRGNKDQLTVCALVIAALTVTVEEKNRSLQTQRTAGTVVGQKRHIYLGQTLIFSLFLALNGHILYLVVEKVSRVGKRIDREPLP